MGSVLERERETNLVVYQKLSKHGVVFVDDALNGRKYRLEAHQRCMGGVGSSIGGSSACVAHRWLDDAHKNDRHGPRARNVRVVL